MEVVQKGSGGPPPEEKKSKSFKFERSKMAYTEMTAKSGIYLHLLCQQDPDPVVLSGGSGPHPPPPSPDPPWLKPSLV